MEVLGRLFNVSLIVATLRTTAPILLVGLGGSFTTKAGIFNIGLEGQMLVGAFFAVFGTIFSGSPWIGVALRRAPPRPLWPLCSRFLSSRSKPTKSSSGSR